MTLDLPEEDARPWVRLGYIEPEPVQPAPVAAAAAAHPTTPPTTTEPGAIETPGPGVTHMDPRPAAKPGARGGKQ